MDQSIISNNFPTGVVMKEEEMLYVVDDDPRRREEEEKEEGSQPDWPGRIRTSSILRSFGEQVQKYVYFVWMLSKSSAHPTNECHTYYY